MEVKIFKSMWGMTEGDTLANKLRLIADAGYDGVEFDPPDVPPADWRKMCADHGLDYIAAIYSLTPEEFATNLKRAADFGPIRVNAQTGRDKYDFDTACAYFEKALQTEREIGIPVAHETHRHRMLYTPWATARYLERFADLKICADFSHWVLVTESRLADVDDLVALAISRAIHVHARVGHEEAPQVSDPRAPEFAEYVNLFESWWDRIRDARSAQGADVLSITPEYGPPNYLPTIPHTREPVANLWNVCGWGADRIRKRWT
ncbi:MAG: sugar phosphate isomerase/epimerase [Phycisphaerales bacterium]|nr:sugar phosphate isomerase/epimerase [Phycisphaerales bacterium]